MPTFHISEKLMNFYFIFQQQQQVHAKLIREYGREVVVVV